MNVLPDARPRPEYSLLDELLPEGPAPPLVSAGIPVGDGAGPTLGNSLHPDAPAARRAAQAEADRLNATTPRAAGEPYRYRVAHHAARQPRDAPHYHVINRAGRQVSGHFFYGRQPTVVRKPDRPQPPKYDAATQYPAPEGSDYSYAQYRTEWHEARANKVTGRQRRRLRKGYELELEAGPATAVIHPRIDVHAQYALQRLLASSDPAARTDGAGMLAAVRAGQLRGIYQEDEQVPALRARRYGRSWWQVIPSGEDAVLLLGPPEAPLIDFRAAVRRNAARLDPALRKAWRTYQSWRRGQLVPCPGAPAPGLRAELAPAYRRVAGTVPLLCQVGTGAGACQAPSAEVTTRIKLKNTTFDCKLVNTAFNPNAKGVIRRVPQAPGSPGPEKLRFLCQWEAISMATGCLDIRAPAWGYAAVVTSPQPVGQDWEFGFIQNVSQAEILHHYTTGQARRLVIQGRLDAQQAAVEPWFSVASVQLVNAGQAATMSDVPFTAAPLTLAGNPPARLDQVCFSGVFDLWLVVRSVKTKAISPVARKRIAFARQWTLRNPADDPLDTSNWLTLGSQHEVLVAGLIPAPKVTGPRANEVGDKDFQLITAGRCPVPPAFDGLCVVGEECVAARPPVIVTD